MVTVKAVIEEVPTKRRWIEEFEVSSLQSAESEIKQIIEMFNNTLKPYEKPRKFIKVLYDYDTEMLKSYLKRVMLELGREAANAYGNRTVKRKLGSWKKIINQFLAVEHPRKTTYKKLLNVIMEFPQGYQDTRAIEFLKSKGE